MCNTAQSVVCFLNVKNKKIFIFKKLSNIKYQNITHARAYLSSSLCCSLLPSPVSHVPPRSVDTSPLRVPTPINRHAVICTPRASGFSLILLHTDNHISSNKKYTTTTTTTTTLDYYQFSWLKIVHVLNNH